MDEGVESVDATWDPGDEEGDEEEEGGAGVEVGGWVRFVEGDGAGQGAEVEEVAWVGPFGGAVVFVALGTDFDVDGVRVEGGGFCCC